MLPLTRVCARCHTEKPLDAFPIKNRSRGTRVSYCVPCRSDYGKEHYRQNMSYYVLKAALARKRSRFINQGLVDEHLRAHPCVDCGETDLVVLDFDHVDPALKDAEVGRLQFETGPDRLRREMDKCVIRCGNCHRLRTARQFGWWRVFVAVHRG